MIEWTNEGRKGESRLSNKGRSVKKHLFLFNLGEQHEGVVRWHWGMATQRGVQRKEGGSASDTWGEVRCQQPSHLPSPLQHFRHQLLLAVPMATHKFLSAKSFWLLDSSYHQHFPSLSLSVAYIHQFSYTLPSHNLKKQIFHELHESQV